MKNATFFSLRQWVKTSPSPYAQFFFKTIKAVLQMEIPAPRSVFSVIYYVVKCINLILDNIARVILWTPLFKSRLASCGKRLFLYGGLPYLSGPLHIEAGSNCRISGKITITGRSSAKIKPQLIIGSNIDVGWMTTLAVGSRIEIQDNVRIAGQCFFAGYPGHPLNAKDRAMGKPETDDQVGDIILEEDVWLATGVSVMAGVTIGKGSIIAAGSVVTRNIPEGVLAGGTPAKVIRELEKSNEQA